MKQTRRKFLAEMGKAGACIGLYETSSVPLWGGRTGLLFSADPPQDAFRAEGRLVASGPDLPASHALVVARQCRHHGWDYVGVGADERPRNGRSRDHGSLGNVCPGEHRVSFR